MEKTWRWFGKRDNITLAMLRQIGVEGIVTALHDVPNGEVWTYDAVMDLKRFIEGAGLRWSVVESLPVCEAVKYAGADRDALIGNYILSLENLGKAGVKTVCYNFMPVIDWVRTDLQHPWADGSSSLYFDRTRFAYFDCRILRREGAEKDYDADMLAAVDALDKTITDTEKKSLIENIIVKTQGFVNGNITENDRDPVSIFRALLAQYAGIGRDALRENMKYFLSAVMPVCERYGINLCVHPDDPPFPLFGLPRIVTCDEDIDWFLHAVDNPHNGLTFCAGSLSAGIHNDVPQLARKYASRTHFVHLRSTKRDAEGNFYEANHLEGDVDMYGMMKALLEVQQRRKVSIPVRPDHGHQMCDDLGRKSNPGYSCYGRLRGIAELRGLQMGIAKSME